MHQNMQLVISFLKLAKQSLDFIVVGNIAHKGFRAGQRQNQVSRFLLQSLILIVTASFAPALCSPCAIDHAIERLLATPNTTATRPWRSNDMHLSWKI